MKFLMCLICAVLFTACGDDSDGFRDPVDALLDNTGRYKLVGLLLTDTCEDPPLADPEVKIPLGEWFVAAMRNEYLFAQEGLILSSPDCETFTGGVVEMNNLTGCVSTADFSAQLSFSDFALSGTIDSLFTFPPCHSFPDYEGFECSRILEIFGPKQ